MNKTNSYYHSFHFAISWSSINWAQIELLTWHDTVQKGKISWSLSSCSSDNPNSDSELCCSQSRLFGLAFCQTTRDVSLCDFGSMGRLPKKSNDFFKNQTNHRKHFPCRQRKYCYTNYQSCMQPSKTKVWTECVWISNQDRLCTPNTNKHQRLLSHCDSGVTLTHSFSQSCLLFWTFCPGLPSLLLPSSFLYLPPTCWW